MDTVKPEAVMARGTFTVQKTRLAGVDAVAAESKDSFARHSHEHYGVGVVLKGAQQSASGRGQVEAMAGDVITVNPGEVHDGAALGGTARTWRMLYFDPDVMAAYAGEIGNGLHPLEMKFPVLSDQAAAANCMALYRAATEPMPLAGLHCDSLILSLLAELLIERPKHEPCPAPQTIQRTIARIDDAPTENHSLEQLGLASGLSRFQVLRAFRRATGFTPHAYILQRRVDLARRLIRTCLELADVAVASGFADQSHMTRCFTQRFGLTPGAYAAACR